MKSRPFPLDQRLHDLLMQEGYAAFTIPQLRDAYAEQIREFKFDIKDLRRYLYGYINRMIRSGWVERDAERRAHGQVYHMREKPKGLRVKLISPGFEAKLYINEPKATHALSSGRQKNSIKQDPNPVAGLAAQCKETQLDMLSSLGEAEKYKSLMEELPQIADALEAEYLDARHRSSRLLGQLRALEKTLLTLQGNGT